MKPVTNAVKYKPVRDLLVDMSRKGRTEWYDVRRVEIENGVNLVVAGLVREVRDFGTGWVGATLTDLGGLVVAVVAAEREPDAGCGWCGREVCVGEPC